MPRSTAFDNWYNATYPVEAFDNPREHEDHRSAAYAGYRQANLWTPIDQLPVGNTAVLLIARDVKGFSSMSYTTDPYCGWKQKDGTFARWPHPFHPTHFRYID